MAVLGKRRTAGTGIGRGTAAAEAPAATMGRCTAFAQQGEQQSGGRGRELASLRRRRGVERLLRRVRCSWLVLLASCAAAWGRDREKEST